MATNLERLNQFLEREVGRALSNAERWDFRSLAVLQDLRAGDPDTTTEDAAAKTVELYGARPEGHQP